jgi:hypothetical protein
MPGLSPLQVLHRLDRKRGDGEETLDAARRRRDAREQFLAYLTKRHSERLGIPIATARERVMAVAVSAKAREDAA